MRHKYVLTGALLASALAAGLLIAQEPADIEPPTFITNVTNVQVPVIVRDAKGNYVNGLAPVDFELLDQGVPQAIKLDVEAHPISLVVAIQADASTRQILPTIQKASSLFGPIVAGETGEVAILAFDSRIQELTPFTSNPDEIKTALGKLKAGNTPHHLDDAAMQGVRMLHSRPKNRKKVLLLISETRDQGSAVNPRDVMTQVEFEDVQVYAVTMNHMLNQLTSKAEPNRPNPIPPEARGPAPMGVIRTGTTDAQTNMGNWTPVFKEVFALVKGIFIPNSIEVYTKFSGGLEENFVSLGGLEDALQKMGEELHSQYLLTFAPTSQEGGYHELTVRVKVRANLDVRARYGYWIAQRGPVEAKKN
ncbi:MAG: VWA domain-containing protein [Acidobacteriota bacterium]